MRTSTLESVLDTYLHAYRELIAVEHVEGSTVISFPFHLAANHRIEITVTDVAGRYIISDGARTLGEIESAGYSLTEEMRDKLQSVASLPGLRIVDSHLLLESSYLEIGISIQKFLEMSKMIGDVYLVHKQRDPAEDDLIADVRTILDSKTLPYRLRHKVQGEIEAHPFDVVIPPNGRPGMAINVLGGRNTHSLAQVWGYKCDDIRRNDNNKGRIKLALIYDIRFQKWSNASKSILASRADIVLPSNSLDDLRSTIQDLF